MTACRRLGALRKIPEADLLQIDSLHVAADELMRKGISGELDDEYVKVLLTNLDYELQGLWRFPADKAFHTYVNVYRFRKEWVGKSYRCLATGVERTISYEDMLKTQETDEIPVGEGFVDVGRLDGYHRLIGVAPLN